MFNELFNGLFQEDKKATIKTSNVVRAFNKKKEEQAKVGAKELKADKRAAEASKKAEEAAGTTSSTHHGKIWETEKAQYGSFYIKNNPTTTGFLSEVSNLPFRTSGDKAAPFFGAIREYFNLPKIQEAIKAEPAFEELWKYLNDSPKPKFRSVDYADFNTNMPPYVLFLTFVFPLVEQDVIDSLFSKQNIVKRFSTIQNSYSGNVLNPIEFNPDIEFSSCEHIKDVKVKAFVKRLQATLMSDTPELAQAQHSLLAGLKLITATLLEGSKRAIGNNKHINEIARTIYYSILSATVPYNLDLFQLDDEEIAKKYANPRDVQHTLLTKRAQDLIYAKKILTLEDAMTTRGTLGRNSRETLAFSYAKATDRLKKSKKNTEIYKAEQFRKIKKSTLDFFNKGLESFPELNAYLNTIDAVLEDFFLEKPKNKEKIINLGKDIQNKKEKDETVDTEAERGSRIQDLSSEAFGKLHDFAVNGLKNIQLAFSNEQYLGKVFEDLVKASPEIMDDVNRETAGNGIEYIKAHIKDVYFGPFKETLENYFKNLTALTKEDVEILIKLAVSILLTENGLMKVRELKPIIKVVYKNHLNNSTLTSNAYRYEGFILFRSILSLDELLLKANKLMNMSAAEESERNKAAKDNKIICPKCNGKGVVLRAGHEEKCPTCYGLGKIQARNLDKEYLEGLLSARKRIHFTRNTLDRLNSIVETIFTDIRRNVRNADVNLTNALVSGADEGSIPEISNFIKEITKDILYNYFTPEALDKLYLFAIKDIDIDDTQEVITHDLVEKAKTGTLATDGTFNSHLNYYSGLTQDFIDFINLTASIKKNYSGLTTNPDGSVELDFNIDPATDSNSFFGDFFFGELAPSIESNPTAKLCLHKYLLSKISLLVAPSIASVNSKTILLPEVCKRSPAACSQIDEYFSSLYNTLTKGIRTAIDEIDEQILEIAGNTTQKIVLSAEQNEYYTRFIPGSKNEDFENATIYLGNKAAFILRKEHGVKQADQLFFNSLLTSKEFENKTEKGEAGSLSEYTLARVKSAIDIITTAINLKVAKYAIMGRKEDDELLSQLLNKYRKEKQQSKEDNVLNAFTAATEMLSAFTKASGFSGTDLIQQENNRIANPILTKILDKFNEFISYESVEKEIVRYSAQEEELVSKGQTDYPAISKKTGKSSKKIILDTTGILYLDTVETPSNEALPAAVPAKEVQETEGLPTVQLFKADEKGILRFDFSVLKTVSKSLTNKIRGYSTTALGKEKRYGSNEAPVKSYTQYINELRGAISVASNRFIDFYYGIGKKQIGDEIKVMSSHALENCKVLDDFFKIIANPSTGPSVLNIGVQQRLLDTLERLQVDGSISMSDSSVLKEDTEDLDLSLLFTPQSLQTKDAGERIDSLFNTHKGSKHILTLMGNGYTPSVISEEVNKILLERINDPAFLALAEEEDVFDRLGLFQTQEEPTTSDIQPSISKVPEGQPFTDTTLPAYTINVPDPKDSTKRIKKLNPNFLTMYLNVFDSATYAAPDEVLPLNEKEACLNNAKKILAGFKAISGTDELTFVQNELQKAFASGNAKNSRLGTDITSLLTNTKQILDTIKAATPVAKPAAKLETKLETAKRILESLIQIEEAETPQQVREPSKENQRIKQESNEIMLELAAILAVRYGVRGSESGLMSQSNQPFSFAFLENAFWILPMFDNSLDVALKTVSKFVKLPDRLWFQVSTNRLQNYVYQPVFNFASIKLLVDKYYKLKPQAEPEQPAQTAQPTPETIK